MRDTFVECFLSMQPISCGNSARAMPIPARSKDQRIPEAEVRRLLPWMEIPLARLPIYRLTLSRIGSQGTRSIIVLVVDTFIG